MRLAYANGKLLEIRCKRQNISGRERLCKCSRVRWRKWLIGSPCELVRNGSAGQQFPLPALSLSIGWTDSIGMSKFSMRQWTDSEISKNLWNQLFKHYIITDRLELRRAPLVHCAQRNRTQNVSIRFIRLKCSFWLFYQLNRWVRLCNAVPIIKPIVQIDAHGNESLKIPRETLKIQR